MADLFYQNYSNFHAWMINELEKKTRCTTFNVLQIFSVNI